MEYLILIKILNKQINATRVIITFNKMKIIKTEITILNLFCFRLSGHSSEVPRSTCTLRTKYQVCTYGIYIVMIYKELVETSGGTRLKKR